jgi:hypothetical protein
LPPGRYEYKFIVDGEWIPDPSEPHEVVNAFGSTNSVVEVGGHTERKRYPGQMDKTHKTLERRI